MSLTPASTITSTSPSVCWKGLALSEGNQVAVATGNCHFTWLRVYCMSPSPLVELVMDRDSHVGDVELQFNGSACCLLERTHSALNRSRFGLLPSTSLEPTPSWYDQLMPAGSPLPKSFDARIPGILGMVNPDCVALWDVEKASPSWNAKHTEHAVNYVYMLDPNTLVNLGCRTSGTHDVLSRYDVRVGARKVQELIIDKHLPLSNRELRSAGISCARSLHSAALLHHNSTPLLVTQSFGAESADVFDLSSFEELPAKIEGYISRGNTGYSGYEVSLQSNGLSHLFHLQHSSHQKPGSQWSDAWTYKNTLHVMQMDGATKGGLPEVRRSRVLTGTSERPRLASNQDHYVYTDGHNLVMDRLPEGPQLSHEEPAVPPLD